ncbi:hypothetical protein RAN3_2556 [plant metagenome]|uniref:Tail fiber assembly protein n=1 Tax=plant metagenome TaxID=1297885 RepID=A0A484U5Q5_9ZZZZ
MTQQITVYQTDSDGLFLHPVVANELPLQPGTYNVPYGARLTAPPEAPAGQVALAVGESWTLVEDHRDATLYRISDGSEYATGSTVLDAGQVVRYPGWGQVPTWLTPLAPPAPGSTWNGDGWDAPESAPEDPAAV